MTASANVIVFLGPTLAVDDARRVLDATYLGPVAQGDVLRALDARPAAIAIIDGYFARVPAVWHKEILWAMAQGVRVYGASSMGALRAAELAAFGMVGVGRIFEAFASGEYEDDDEVAVAHGEAATGYRALSDAMVDLRATFARAVADGVIDDGVAAALIARGKARPYAQRSFAAVVGAAPELDRLRAWLPGHRVAQKRLDALALLETVRDQLGLAPAPPSFRFERTDAWDQLSRRSGHRHTTGGRDPRATAYLLDELRLAAPGVYRAALDGALARVLAGDAAHRHEVAVDDALIGDAGRRYFLDRATLSPAAIQAWMAGEHLDADGLGQLLHREAPLHWARTMYQPDVLDHLPDQLRATVGLAPLLARAAAKHRLETTLGDALAVEPPDIAALLHWFFTERRAMPPPGDAEACAQVLGFDSVERMLRALALERQFAG